MRNSAVNFGVLIDVRNTDFQAGGETGVVFESRLKTGNWTDFLPSDEKQLGVYFDSMACVTFSALNCVESQINWMISIGLIPKDKLNRLKELGFIDDDGKFNCSDRFTAYMSGTTRSGNYLYKVWDSIRKDGLLPEKDWPFPSDQRTPVFDWDNFYSDPGAERKAKAKLILEILDIQYQWIWTNVYSSSEPLSERMKQYLQLAPIQVVGPVCKGWGGNDIVQPDGQTNCQHATMMYYRPEQFTADFDHYNPFRKRLAVNYVLPFALQGVVKIKDTPIVVPPVETVNQFKYNFSKDIVFGERSNAVKALQKALKINGCFPTNVAETGYYGEITRIAVDKFARKYNVASLWELLVVKGKRVGPKTRAKLNQLFNN